mmetsp:Transcript_13245/g.37123  ORF Transcript_13245/g.37123 Transcript_13245/m.37123 type:complete len:351 (+) Transcript_13245:1131-2183(+)
MPPPSRVRHRAWARGATLSPPEVVVDGAVDLLASSGVGQHGHVGLARLEDVQDVVHRDARVHSRQGVELDLSREHRNFVVRVQEQELLGDDEANDVLPPARDVNRDPGVAGLHDALDDRPVQDRVARQHEADRQRRHRHEGRLVGKAQGPRDDLHLVPAELAALALHRAVELHQRLELLPLHQPGVVLPYHVVQELGEGVRDDRRGVHQHLDHGREAASDGEPELLAQGLGEDLPEEQDRGDGHRDGHHLVRDLVQKDGEGLHGHGVAQEERHEEPVLALEHRHDALRVPLLPLRPALYQHEEVDLLETQQAQRQAAHEAREQHESDADAHEHPELRRGRRNPLLLHLQA